MNTFSISKFLALLLFTTGVVFAQPKAPSWSKLYKQGQDAFEQKNYALSSSLLREAVLLKPSHAATLNAAALACFQYRDYASAKKYWSDIDMTSKNLQKYPLLKYYTSICDKNVGNYAAAVQGFDAFLANYPLNDAIYKEALAYLAGCSFALNIASRQSSSANVENMGSTVNTPDSEQSATDSADPDKMVFTSSNDQTVEIKTVDKDGKITVITPQGLNSDLRVGSLVIATNGKAYFTAYNGKYHQIYEATLIDNTLTNIKPCNNSINGDKVNAKDPFIGQNERGQEMMIFASDRIGTRGGLDLWSSVNLGNGWTDPKNLGEQINTPYDEISPFFDANSKKLYYSTNRPEGIGGFDVMCSSGFGRYWQKPLNMSMPINSCGDDYHFRINPDGTRGIVSSNRSGSQTLNFKGTTDDLYSVVLAPNKTDASPNLAISKIKIYGSVIDKKTRNELTGFQISLFEVIDGSPVLVDRSRSDSGYDFVLDKDKVYVIEAEANDIRIETFLIDPTDYNGAEITRDIVVVR